MRHRGGEQCVLDTQPFRRGQRVVGEVHRGEREQRRYALRGFEDAELFGESHGGSGGRADELVEHRALSTGKFMSLADEFEGEAGPVWLAVFEPFLRCRWAEFD